MRLVLVPRATILPAELGHYLQKLAKLSIRRLAVLHIDLLNPAARGYFFHQGALSVTVSLSRKIENDEGQINGKMQRKVYDRTGLLPRARLNSKSDEWTGQQGWTGKKKSGRKKRLPHDMSKNVDYGY